MARRRSFPRTGAVRRSRQTTWIAPADQESIAVSSTAKAIIQSFDPAAAGLLAPTIIRTRGEASVRAQTFGADVTVSGAFGICVVSDQAFAAGVASIPGPFDQADWNGWFVWQSFIRAVEFVSAVGVEPNVVWPYQVDSKAMRKVRDNETIVMVAQSQSGAFNIGMHLRMLLMLS